MLVLLLSQKQIYACFVAFLGKKSACSAALTGKNVLALLLSQEGICLLCCSYRKGCALLLLQEEKCLL